MTGRILIPLAVIAAVSCSSGQDRNDLNAPMGWSLCTSLEGGHYDLTGGTGGREVTLANEGGDFGPVFEKAVNENDIIILDGSQGEFVVSEVIRFKGVANKTIVGINGATLRTAFSLDDEIKGVIENSVSNELSSASGTGGVLSNGTKVEEAQELATRQALIDFLGDESEKYRWAGIVNFIDGCENVIIRNLAFIGPGAMDLGGSPLLEVDFSGTHFWIDHCSFCDAQRNNMTIGAQCDFVDVTWCSFDYTDKSYNHNYSNLVGGGDNPEFIGVDKLNVTFAFCWWTERVDARMPMVRFGNVHVLNCYYGEGVDGPNPRMDSEVRVEGCYFDRGCKCISRYDADGKSVPKAYQYVGNYSVDGTVIEDKGQVNMPYGYRAADAATVKDVVTASAGPTLKDPLRIGR